LDGKYYTDIVCVSSDVCTSNNFELIGITKASGLKNLDGILGLSPEFSNNSNIVFSLKNNNIIDNLVIGFLILDE
jgi:hypothetical protein